MVLVVVSVGRSDGHGRGGGGGGRALPAALLRHLVVVALVATGLTLPAALPPSVVPAPFTPPPAQAAVQSPFTPVYSADENGAIATIGNSSMDCPTATSGCAAARAGTASGASLNNNNYAMQFTDVDGDASTTNSSTSTLALPAGSTVLNARLVWGGRTTAGSSGVAASGNTGQVKLKAPGQGAYTTVTGATKGFSLTTATASDGAPYQGSLDVTDAVRAGGNGVYSVGDIRAATGADRYAGWALVVAYRNPSLPLRNLTVFDGFADVTTTSAANSTVDIPISGFLTPTSGAVNASVGVVAWEGDQGTTGDAMAMGGTTLSDATRPANNFFDSKVSDSGTDLAGRSPGYANNFGVDVGRVSANNVLPNGAVATTLRMTTTGDYYYPGIVTSQIDLFTPSFNAVSKTAVNASGNDPARPGDTLEYTVSLTNTGLDPADNAVVRDVLPAGVTYVPGSLRRTANPGQSGTLAVSDAAGDDPGEYTPADRTLRMRVGTNASATAGGSLAANATTSFTFRATVNRDASGTTIANTPLLDYRARTLARDYTYTGNTTSTAVSALADLQATLTAAPAAQAAGGTVTHTIGATNRGPNPTGTTTLVDTLPAGVTFQSAAPPAGTTCTPSGQTVTCTGGPLAVGASLTVPITVRVAPEAATGTVTNSVQVSGDVADDVPTNNVATAPTQVSRSADLAVTTGIGAAVAGRTTTVTSTVTNNGPSTAEGVVLTDPLPAGTTFVSGTVPGGTCSATGNTVSCVLAAPLAPGASATSSVVVRLDPSYAPERFANAVTASSTTPDAVGANNAATADVPVGRLADVRLEVTGPATIDAGGRVTYTVRVINDGPSDARDVRLTDTTLNRLVPVDVDTSSGTCSLTSNPPGCTLGTIPAGASTLVTAVADAPASLPAGTQTATASATTSTPETNTGNNTGSVSSTVRRLADRSVAIGTAGTVTAGAPTTFAVDARNAGPSDSSRTTVTTTLPAGVVPRSATFAGGSCDITGQVVTCPVGTLTPNQSTRVTIEALVAPNRPVTDPAPVTAVITGDGTDGNGANDRATADLAVVGAADVTLSSTADKASVVAGEEIVYTLRAGNNGPSTAAGVTVSDRLPDGLTAIGATASSGNCSIGGGGVTCAVGALDPRAEAVVTVRARVAPTRPAGPLTHTGTVATTTPETSTSNNDASTTTAVTTRADLRAEVTGAPGTAVAGGEPVTYTVAVTNQGPSVADGLVVIDDLPDGLTPVSATVDGRPCTVTAARVTCAAGVVGPGQRVEVVLTARVDADVPAGPLPLTITATSPAPDPTPADARVAISTPVTTAADLRTVVAPDPATLTDGALVAGSRGALLVTTRNAGPSDAVTVTSSTTLPVGVVPVSAVPAFGSCRIAGQVVECSAPLLPAGSDLTVRITTDVAPDTSGPVVVEASSGSATAEAAPADNGGRAELPVTAAADLGVTLSGVPATVRAGTTATYTALVTNNGPSDASAVVLDQSLPAGFVLAPGGVAVDGGTCTPNPEGTAVRCTFDTVRAGVSIPVVLRAIAAPDRPAGTVTATATVGSPTTDPTPDDRTATTSTTVTSSADLAVTLAPTRDTPEAGGRQKYVVSVVNNGPSTATGVVSTTPVPAGATLVGATSSLGACDAGRCAIGVLAPGAVATVQVEVAVAPDFAGPLAATTTVASGTPDPERANDSASVSQAVAARADLVAGVTLPDQAPVAGRTATYRVTARNDGPSAATRVVLSSPLPAGTTLVGVTAAGGTCTPGVVSCTVPTLAVGATATVDVTVAVSPDAVGGAFAIGSTVSSAVTDPDGGNNSASASAPVTAQADLATSVVALSGTPTAGQEVRWQATVRNEGPSRATGVRLVDDAPAGARITGTQVAAGRGSCTTTALRADCTLADLGVGEEAVVTVVAVLDADLTATELVTTARASTSGAVDPVPANDAGTARIAIGTSADLRVGGTTGTEPVVAGTGATWTLRVDNAGPSTARGVVLTDRLPDGVAVTAASVDGRPCTVRGALVECAVGDLAPGSGATVTVTGTVAPGVVLGSLSDQATVRSGTADPDPANNQAATPLRVTTSADLALAVTGPERATAGASATWTARVRNDGPSDAGEVAATLRLPPGLGAVTATSPAGTCTIDLAAGTATCPVGTLAAGAELAVTLTGTPDPAYTGAEIVVEGSVASRTPDPDPADGAARVATPVVRSADVAVRTDETPLPVVPGRQVTWTTTVRNDGPSTAAAVTLTDTAPAGVLDVRAVSGRGPCEVADLVSTCRLGDLAPGASVLVTVTGTVDPAYVGGPLVHRAQGATTTPDPEAANDAAETATPTAPQADLRVGTAVTSGPPVAGAPVTLEIDVVNDGPSTAADTVVSFPIPGNVVPTPGSSRPSQGTCAVEGTVLRCRLGALAPGATATITAAGTVRQDFGEVVAVSASVTSATPDDDPGDNTSTAAVTVGDSADLGVTVDAPREVVAGERVAFPVTVVNNGPSNARNVVVRGQAPPDLLDLRFDGVPPGACTLAAGEIVCRLGDRPAGVPVTATISGVVDPGTAPGPRTYQVGVSSETPDPNTRNNTVAPSPTVRTRADLAVAVELDPRPVVPGRGLLAALTVRNAGPSNAGGTVTTDPLPDGVEFAATPVLEGAACRVVGRSLSCDVAALGPRGELRIEVPLTVAPSVVGPELRLGAAVGGGVEDPDPANDTASVGAPVDARADLRLELAGPQRVVAGRPLEYTATLVSSGPSTARDVELRQRLPEGLRDVTVTSSQGTCTVEGRDLVCRLGAVGPGETLRVVVRADGTLGADVAGPTVEATATVTSGTAEPADAAPGGDGRSATASTAVDTEADVAVTVAGPTAPVPGEPVSYRVVARNDGPSTARAVTVGIDLPPGTTDVAIAAPPGVTCDVAARRCTLDTLAPGGAGAVALTVTGVLAPTITGPVVATVRAEAATGDPDPGDNTATTGAAAVPAADLAITQTVGPDPLVAGGEVLWTVRVQNAGPSTATGVVVEDLVPAGVGSVSISGPAGSGCAGTRCTIAALAPGPDAAVVLTVRGVIGAELAGRTLSNTVSVSSAVPDPVADDDRQELETAVTGSADVRVALDAPETVTAGEALRYRIGVTTAGPSEARDVVVTLPAPLGATLVAGRPSQGTCALETNTLVCRLGTLAPGAAPSIEVDGTAQADALGSGIAATASVTSSTPDPDAAGSTATAGTDLQRLADVSVEKTVTPDPVVPGQDATYRIVVANTGPSDAQRIRVTDRLPAGVTAGPVTSTLGACRAENGSVGCDIATLPAGERAEIRVPVAVSPGARADALSNTATATSATEDRGPGANTSTVAGAAAPRADLVVATAPSRTSALPGTPVTWTSTITNRGPSRADGTLVTVTLPPGLDGAVVGGARCGPPVEGTVLCELDDLAPNAPVTITVSGTVSPDAVSEQVLGVAASSPAAELVPANNASTTPVEVTPQADLALTKRALGPVVAGQDVTWELTATNAGPSPAVGAVVTDRLPAQLADVRLDGEGCSATAGVVRCPLGDVPARGSRTVRITALVDPAATGERLANAAEVTSSTPEPGDPAQVSDGTATTDDVIERRTGLTLDKEAYADEVVVGGLITWKLTATNAGPSAAPDATVLDELPGRGTPDPENPAATVEVVGTTPSGSFDAATGRWSIGALGPRETRELSITARVVTAGDLTNRARIGPDGEVVQTPGSGTEPAAPPVAQPPAEDTTTTTTTPTTTTPPSTTTPPPSTTTPPPSTTTPPTTTTTPPTTTTTPPTTTSPGAGGDDADGSGPGGSGGPGSVSDPDGSDDAASAAASAEAPSTTPPGGWLAYTGVWVLPILVAALLSLGGGAVLLLIARRRRENRS